MTWWQIMLLCALSGAVIGYATNWLAIKMLFRPRRSVGLWRFRIQGVLPARRRLLAESIGEVVERELVSHRDILAHLDNEEIYKKISRVCSEEIEMFVKEKFYSVVSLPGIIFPFEMMVKKLRKYSEKQIAKKLPALVREIMGNLDGVIQIREMVTEKIEKFEAEELEKIVLEIAKRELRCIEIFGGVLGLIVGLAQFAIIQFLR